MHLFKVSAVLVDRQAAGMVLRGDALLSKLLSIFIISFRTQSSLQSCILVEHLVINLICRLPLMAHVSCLFTFSQEGRLMGRN